MGTKCTQYSKSWKFYCSVIQGLIKLWFTETHSSEML